MCIDYDFVLQFATKKHEGQFRADGITPYIVHPILTAEYIRKYKSSSGLDIVMAAALLHDTLEDTYTSYRELEDLFGEVVASIVMEVTNASYMPKLVGKGNYLKEKMLMMSSYALDVKLADRLANITDFKGLTLTRYKKLEQETVEILSYLESNRELTQTQQSLINAIYTQIRANNQIINYCCTKMAQNLQYANFFGSDADNKTIGEHYEQTRQL